MYSFVRERTASLSESETQASDIENEDGDGSPIMNDVPYSQERRGALILHVDNEIEEEVKEVESTQDLVMSILAPKTTKQIRMRYIEKLKRMKIFREEPRKKH